MKELFDKSKFSFLFIVSCFAFLVSCEECVILALGTMSNFFVYALVSFTTIVCLFVSVILSIKKRKTKFNLLILVLIGVWIVSFCYYGYVLIHTFENNDIMIYAYFDFPCIFKMTKYLRSTYEVLDEWFIGIYLNWVVSLVMVIAVFGMILIEQKKNKKIKGRG